MEQVILDKAIQRESIVDTELNNLYVKCREFSRGCDVEIKLTKPNTKTKMDNIDFITGLDTHRSPDELVSISSIKSRHSLKKPVYKTAAIFNKSSIPVRDIRGESIGILENVFYGDRSKLTGTNTLDINKKYIRDNKNTIKILLSLFTSEVPLSTSQILKAAVVGKNLGYYTVHYLYDKDIIFIAGRTPTSKRLYAVNEKYFDLCKELLKARECEK